MSAPAVYLASKSPRREELLRQLGIEFVSLQLRALVQAGLLECRAEKTQRFYRARQEALGPVGRMLEGMWNDALWRLKLAAELEQTRRGPSPARRRPIGKKKKKKMETKK